MTTIDVKIIRNPQTGYEEVFRTTKPGYVPQGWELVTNLQSFAIGGPLPYGETEKPRKKSFWKRLFE